MDYECTITEDALTNALFYGVALDARFVGSKLQARVIARQMLRALLSVDETALLAQTISRTHGGR